MRARSLIGCLAMVVAFVAVVIGLSPHEPTYQGRGLRAWLREMQQPSPVVRQNAQEALTHLGTNAVPTLREILHSEDSPLKTNIIHLLSQQRLVRIRFVPARERRISAAIACFVLGPRADAAIPDLFAFGAEDSYCRNLAESALGQMGQGAVERIAYGLTNEDLNIRRTAAAALHRIDAPGTKAVALLVNCLNDRYGSIRTEAAYALSSMGASPEILNGLTQALDDDEPGVRIAAASSLVEIGQSAIPILSNRLKTSDLQASLRIHKVLQDIAAAEKANLQ